MEQLSLMLKNSNLVRYLPTVIIPAIGDTLKMVFISAALSIFFGIFFGIILVTTADDGLSPHPLLHGILGKVTDIVRSFPMMILIVAVAPLTRIFIGTKIGVNAAICYHTGEYAVCHQDDRELSKHGRSAINKNGALHRRFQAPDHLQSDARGSSPRTDIKLYDHAHQYAEHFCNGRCRRCGRTRRRSAVLRLSAV